MNLLPEEKKKEFAKEYNLKYFSVLFYLLAFAFLIAGSSVFPDYVMSRIDMIDYQNRNNSISSSETASTTAKIQADFKDFEEKINFLAEALEDSVSPSLVLSNVIGEKTSGISLESFSYYSETGGKKIVISGVAGTRDSLLLYKRKLEANLLFESVELPVSNFTKRTDIEFTTTLTIKNPQLDEKK
jgi:hypothetical protein